MLISVINKNNMKYVRVGYKYGIKVQIILDHYIQLNKESGGGMWKKAIDKERKKFKISLKFVQEG